MMFTLIDEDDTLDTLLECDECHTQLRYSYNGTEAKTFDGELIAGEDGYSEFVDRSIADAKETHECPK